MKLVDAHVFVECYERLVTKNDTPTDDGEDSEEEQTHVGKDAETKEEVTKDENVPSGSVTVEGITQNCEITDIQGLPGMLFPGSALLNATKEESAFNKERGVEFWNTMIAHSLIEPIIPGRKLTLTGGDTLFKYGLTRFPLTRP